MFSEQGPAQRLRVRCWAQKFWTANQFHEIRFPFHRDQPGAVRTGGLCKAILTLHGQNHPVKVDGRTPRDGRIPWVGSGCVRVNSGSRPVTVAGGKQIKVKDEVRVGEFENHGREGRPILASGKGSKLWQMSSTLDQ